MNKTNKKGNVFVYGFIALTLGVVLLGSLAIPMVSTLYKTQDISEVLTLNDNTATSLTYNISEVTSVYNSTVTVDSTNYTVDLDADTIVLNDAVVIKNETDFTVAYSYYDPKYLGSASDRTLAGVITVALIIGLAYAGFKMFDLA